jgi:hypothetical protein
VLTQWQNLPFFSFPLGELEGRGTFLPPLAMPLGWLFFQIFVRKDLVSLETELGHGFICYCK